MTNATPMPEPEYRALIQAAFDQVLKALDDADPDVVEAELSQGTLNLRLADGARWILSGQPPVRQLWLAVASKGRAFHFDYDRATGQWRDDKGEGIELFSYLAGLLREVTGLSVKF
jgi:CyaY protein